MLRSAFSLLILLATATSTAWAVSPESVLQPSSFRDFNIESLVEAFVADDYRIGDEWGKKPVTAKDLSSSPHFERMATATARVRGGGTGFYMGKYNGMHLLATNNHVCPEKDTCSWAGAVEFPLLKKSYTMSRYIGTWTDIDLAILAIEVPKEDEALLASLASPFAFNTDVYTGQELTTIGFGVGSNPGRVMVANQDNDCKVFSAEGEYRHLKDPDDYNPGPHLVWSFANGCDVSHGDSGSAMMDRRTGEVIGIIWTGKIPKNTLVQDSKYLQELLRKPSEVIWKELSYAVPAVMMKKVLLQAITDKKLTGVDADTIQALIAAQE